MVDEIGFAGQVALVTGGGNGVGRAHALELAARGARVVVNDLGIALDGSGASIGAADRVVGEIRALGGEAIANGDSVTEAHGAQRMVRAALDQWGQLDIVVNNAGVLDTEPFETSTRDRDAHVVDTHLLGAMNVARAAWPVLIERGYGRMVNTSSGAIFGSPVGLAYQAAKGGVFALTRGLATAGVSHGVLVNAIMPTAYTRMTDQIPDEAFRAFMEARFTPERVARFAVVLAHASCTFSGEAFMVGGGRVARVLLGVSGGWVGSDPSPEDYRAELDAVMALGGASYPHDRLEEFGAYIGRLGFGSTELDFDGLVKGDER